MINWINKAKPAPIHEEAVIGKFTAIITQGIDGDGDPTYCWRVVGPHTDSNGSVDCCGRTEAQALLLAKDRAMKVIDALK